MRLSLLILLALLAVTWLEFQVYPGHVYPGGETQLLAPMLERLDAPGFLSRDLVASHPVFAHTVYDEVTLFLHSALHRTFEQALVYQQAFFRFVALLGLFLAARPCKVNAWAAVLLSGVINAVTHLAAPNAFLTSPYATPSAFALALAFLAAGLLMNGLTLLAGLAGGSALLYEPATSAPFWLAVLLVAVVDGSSRRRLRPLFLSLLIFSLLLGNFSQMQSGAGAQQTLISRLDDAAVHLTQVRTPWLWISHWASAEIWSYCFVAVAGVWALARLGGLLERFSCWMVLGLTAGGLISAGAAAGLLHLRLPIALSMPLGGNLVFTLSFGLLAAGAAGWQAFEQRKWGQMVCWALLPCAAVLNAQVLDLTHGSIEATIPKRLITPELDQLARWADESTWGSSLFQFPDAGVSPAPGVFRALSRRALWADWDSGAITGYSPEAGKEWWERWRAAHMDSYAPEQLADMLRLPIDYFVLERRHELAGIRPVFSNRLYVVYDTQDLRQESAKRLN